MLATRSDLRAGSRLLRGMQQHIAAHDEQIGALIESGLRIHERLEQVSQKLDLLTEAQRGTEQKLDLLAEAQRATEQSLKAFLDSLRRGGNGNPAPSAS